jgi:ABC-type uncharacterized transport system ATPase subunit
VADRVLILANGRRVALESVHELRQRQVGATRLVVEVSGDAAPARAALERSGFACEILDSSRLVVDGAAGRGVAALEAVRDAGVAVRSFELSRPTLEELFLTVVRRERALPTGGSADTGASGVPR